MSTILKDGKLVRVDQDVFWEKISNDKFLEKEFIIMHLERLNPTLILKNYRERLPKNTVQYLESLLE